MAAPIIVTGAAGFIGHSVAHRLLDRGERVIGVDICNDYYDPALKEARLATFTNKQAFSFERMDIADACLEQADWVTASIHYGQRQPREQITQRILGALENPHVHAISHPTGRLISRREPYDVDISAVIESAKTHGKYLELNAHPSRLDLNDINTAAAVAAGVMIVINTDAHSISNLDLMKYGITQAKRAGVVPENVLNSLRLVDLKRRLGIGMNQMGRRSK